MEQNSLIVFYQWLYVFGILGFVLFPAFRLMRIAKKNGETLWVFFVVGLLMGIFVLVVDARFLAFLNEYAIVSAYMGYLWIPLMLIGYLLSFLGTVVVAKWWIKQRAHVESDLLDSDLLQKKN